MGIKSKIVGYFPVFAIIIISVCAFVPSFFEQGITKELDIEQQKLSDNQIAYQYFTEQAQTVFNYDNNLYTLAWQEIGEAIESNILFSITAPNNTLTENETYISTILYHLDNWNILIEQTYSRSIQHYFTVNPQENFFDLGGTAAGIRYGISRFDWAEQQLYYQTTLGDFILEDFGQVFATPNVTLFSDIVNDYLLNNYVDELNSPFSMLNVTNSLYVLDPTTNLFNLTQQPLFYLQGVIDDSIIKIIELENQRTSIRTAVSIMTIATLLASALSTRLEERKTVHAFSVVRADINKDDSYIVREVDVFSAIMLLLAVILAISGLFLAFLF